MSDLYVIPTNDGADLTYRGEDARLTSGIEVAVYLSLFMPQSYADMLDATPRYTSRIPAIVATSTVTNETRRAIEAEALRALKWLTDDGVAGSVEASAVISSSRQIDLTVKITQPSGDQEIRYAVNWDSQKALLAEV